MLIDVPRELPPAQKKSSVCFSKGSSSSCTCLPFFWVGICRRPFRDPGVQSFKLFRALRKANRTCCNSDSFIVCRFLASNIPRDVVGTESYSSLATSIQAECFLACGQSMNLRRGDLFLTNFASSWRCTVGCNNHKSIFFEVQRPSIDGRLESFFLGSTILGRRNPFAGCFGSSLFCFEKEEVPAITRAFPAQKSSSICICPLVPDAINVSLVSERLCP